MTAITKARAAPFNNPLSGAIYEEEILRGFRGAASSSDLYSSWYAREGIDIVLVGGQSNAQGVAPTTEAATPSYLTSGPLSNVGFWNGSTVIEPYSLTERGRSGTGKNWLSAGGITAARWGFTEVASKLLADTWPNVVMCQVTAGGSRLGLSEAIFPGASSWNTNYGLILGTYKYLQELNTKFDALISFCQARNIPYRIRGMLWHQGEADNHPSVDSAYQANLTSLIAEVRSFTGVAALPFVFGTVPAVSSSYNATVRAAQLAVDAADANAYCRDNNGLAYDLAAGDPLHWGASACVTFGTWAASTLISAQP
jgi:hypothetical protein